MAVAEVDRRVQRMGALRRANEVRAARVKLRKAIKAGQIRVADLLLDPPDEVLGMEVFDLISAQKGWGRGRTLSLLATVPLRENKKIGEMTARQRRMLAERADPGRGW